MRDVKMISLLQGDAAIAEAAGAMPPAHAQSWCSSHSSALVRASAAGPAGAGVSLVPKKNE